MRPSTSASVRSASWVCHRGAAHTNTLARDCTCAPVTCAVEYAPARLSACASQDAAGTRDCVTARGMQRAGSASSTDVFLRWVSAVSISDNSPAGHASSVSHQACSVAANLRRTTQLQGSTSMQRQPALPTYAPCVHKRGSMHMHTSAWVRGAFTMMQQPLHMARECSCAPSRRRRGGDECHHAGVADVSAAVNCNTQQTWSAAT